MILAHITLEQDHSRGKGQKHFTEKSFTSTMLENPKHKTTGKKNRSSETYHRVAGLIAADASIVNTAGAGHVQIPAEIQDAPEEQRKKIKRLYHFTSNAFHQAALIRGLSRVGRLWTPSLPGQCWLS